MPVQVPTAGVAQNVTKPSEECSCIKTARSLGVKIPYGTDAADLIPNSTPVIGGLVLLKYGSTSHVAVLEGFEGRLALAEGNFWKGPCEVTRRSIGYDDPHLVGFWVPHE